MRARERAALDLVGESSRLGEAVDELDSLASLPDEEMTREKAESVEADEKAGSASALISCTRRGESFGVDRPLRRPVYLTFREKQSLTRFEQLESINDGIR